MRSPARFPAALASLAVAACAASVTDGAPSSLEGTRWILAGEKAGDAEAPRVEFTDKGRLNGYTGCNMLAGSYKREGDQLEIIAVTTRRACPGPGAERESRLLAVLADRPRLTLGPGQLVLTGQKGGRAEFEAARAH